MDLPEKRPYYGSAAESWLARLGDQNPLGWTVVGKRTLRALVPGPGALCRNAGRRPAARSVTLTLTPEGVVYTTEPVWT